MPTPTITKIQGAGIGGSNALSVSATFAGSVTAGDLLTAEIGHTNGAGIPIDSVTDTLGNTWSKVTAASLDGPSTRYEIWWAIAGSSGACTVTASWLTTNRIGVIYLNQWNTDLGTWQIDAADSFAETVATSTQHCAPVGEINTTELVTLIIAGGCTDGVGGTGTPATGFTNNTPGGFSRQMSEYKITTAIESAQRGGWSGGASRTSANAIVAFGLGFVPGGERCWGAIF